MEPKVSCLYKFVHRMFEVAKSIELLPGPTTELAHEWNPLATRSMAFSQSRDAKVC